MTKIEKGLTLLFLGTMITGMNMTPPIAKLSPPIANKIPKDVTIHGDTRIDNYFWLRERDTQPVLDYLNAENDFTFAKMEHTQKLQEKLYQEMRGRIKEDDSTVPYKFGTYQYYTRTEEGQQYDIYCRKQGSMAGKEEVTLNLNEMAQKHDYLVLNAYKISPDEKKLAFTIDTTGAEFHKLIIRRYMPTFHT